jgi:hypothetical protein
MIYYWILFIVVVPRTDLFILSQLNQVKTLTSSSLKCTNHTVVPCHTVPLSLRVCESCEQKFNSVQYFDLLQPSIYCRKLWFLAGFFNQTFYAVVIFPLYVLHTHTHTHNAHRTILHVLKWAVVASYLGTWAPSSANSCSQRGLATGWLTSECPGILPVPETYCGWRSLSIPMWCWLNHPSSTQPVICYDLLC